MTSSETPDILPIAEALARLRTIIIDREGEEIADQFILAPYIITLNIEGSGYEEGDVFTLVQLEKGVLGMEDLVACVIGNEEGDSYVLCGDHENTLEIIQDACDKAYRHWHWLDLPNTLDGMPTDDPEDDIS